MNRTGSHRAPGPAPSGGASTLRAPVLVWVSETPGALADALPAPPPYFPPGNGRYVVGPGFMKFGADAGGGAADRQVFQFDHANAAYREAKLASRRSATHRHDVRHELRETDRAAVALFILRRLASEHPRLFNLVDGDRGERVLRCQLGRETLTFSSDLNRVSRAGPVDVDPPYRDALDAIACQLQEDLAVVRTEGDGHWLAAAHVCLPSGWDPAEKVGRDFAAIHGPVAGMESMNRRGGDFARLMTAAEAGIVRFGWGIAFDDRLNQHPSLPRTPFDPRRPRAFLRTERQTIFGFPRHGLALFTIRVYLRDLAPGAMSVNERLKVASAIESMPAASLAYKNLGEARDELIAWLREGGGRET